MAAQENSSEYNGLGDVGLCILGSSVGHSGLQDPCIVVDRNGYSTPNWLANIPGANDGEVPTWSRRSEDGGDHAEGDEDELLELHVDSRGVFDGESVVRPPALYALRA